MIIESVRVQNFRSVLDQTLTCDKLTALVGANGSGKSSLLRAIELFYAPDPKVTEEDFYAEDVSNDIEISVTFTGLRTGARARFAKYVEGDTLTVVRVLSLTQGTPSARYHGSTMQNAAFATVRSAGGKREIKAKYDELREEREYADLPSARSADAAQQAMEEWEAAHPNECVRIRDDGQFFGFKQVAQGYLGEHTRFIFIPAVRDAAEDAAEGRGSAISELMDLVVRSALAQREDLVKFREDVQTQYEELVDPAKLVELGALGDRLTHTLRTFVPGGGVDLAWLQTGNIDIPMPKAQVKLVEDGYSASVARTGHGLQRAFILTLLQHLAIARSVPQAAGEPVEAQAAQAPTVPDLLLAIEEPELYQHPNSQRHIAKILLRLAEGTIPGVAGRTQIVYATHSPLFVGTDRFDQIRLARKVDAGEDRPKKTELVSATLDRVAEELWNVSGQQGERFTGDSLRARLQAIMTPWMNEGFFADVAVLVEGEDDRAAVLGVGAERGCDLEANGIAVIPCSGKTNIDRPLLIFRTLGISTYVIWDSDQGEEDPKPHTNRLLLRLLGEAEEDYPSKVANTFACFERKLEDTLKSELGGEVFDELLAQIGTDFGITKRKHTIKNPMAIRELIERARKQGKTSPTLEEITDRIVGLQPTVMPVPAGGDA